MNKRLCALTLSLSFLNTTFATVWDSSAYPEVCQIISKGGSRSCSRLIELNADPATLMSSQVLDRQFYTTDGRIYLDPNTEGESRTVIYARDNSRPNDQQFAFFYLKGGKVTKVAVSTKYEHVDTFPTPSEILESSQFKNKLAAFVSAYKGKVANSGKPLLEASVAMNFLDKKTLTESSIRADESGKVTESISWKVKYVEAISSCQLPSINGWIEVEKVNSPDLWKSCTLASASWVDRSSSAPSAIVNNGATTNSEIIASMQDTVKDVLKKNDAEIKAIYQNNEQKEQGTYSEVLAKKIQDVRDVNKSTNMVLNRLGLATRSLVEKIYSKAEGQNNPAIQKDVVEAKKVYETLQVETIKTLSIDSQIKAQQSANETIAAGISGVAAPKNQQMNSYRPNSSDKIFADTIKLAIDNQNPKLVVSSNQQLIKKIDETGLKKLSAGENHEMSYLGNINEVLPSKMVSNKSNIAITPSINKAIVMSSSPTTTPKTANVVATVTPVKASAGSSSSYQWAGGGKFIKIGNEEYWVDSTGRQPDGTFPGQAKAATAATTTAGTGSYQWAGGGKFVKVDDQEYWVDSTLHQPDGSPLPKTKAIRREEEWLKPKYDADYWTKIGGKERYREMQELMPDQIESIMKTLNPEQLKIVNKENAEYENYMEGIFAKGAENIRNSTYPTFCPYPNFVLDMNDCISPDGYNVGPNNKVDVIGGPWTLKGTTLRIGSKIPSPEEWVKMGAQGRAEARRKLIHGQLQIVIGSLNAEQQEQVAKENAVWKSKIPAGVLLPGNVFDPYQLPKDSNFFAELQKLRTNPYGLYADRFPATGQAGQILFVQQGADFLAMGDRGQWQSGGSVANQVHNGSGTYIMYEWVPRNWSVALSPTIDSKFGERFYKTQGRGNPYTRKFDDFEVNHLTRDAYYFRNGGK